MQNELYELEKLDAIRSRLGVSYEDAKRALDQAEGDTIRALTMLETEQHDVLALSADLLDEIQKLIGAASARTLKIKFGGKVVREVPLALTATTAFILGMAAVLITKASLEIEREENSEVQS